MIDTVLTFSRSTQSLTALREASYRLIGVASTKIDATDENYVCSLSSDPKQKISDSELSARFLDLVTDENLREQIEQKTQPLRDVIVALAFGAMAQGQNT